LTDKSQIFNNYTYHSLLIFAALILIALWVDDSNAQELDQDPGHKEYLSINGLRFSLPNDFDTRRLKATDQIIYVPHEEYDLGLFVAVPDKAVNAEYIRELSALVASYLFPKEKPGYSWKRLEDYWKVSKFEFGGGMMQGFNGRRRVLVQYRQIRVSGREAIAGYTFGLGRGSEAKRLFEKNLGGDSMPGWYAQAHVIASITGEKYKEINPGTSFISAPPTRKN
jgi:hypothetical protein